MKSTPPSINIARLTYLLVCEGAGVAIALSTKGGMHEVPMATGIVGGLGVAALFIWIESLMRGFSLRGFSTATFGLGVGLFCAWLLTRVQISNLLELAMQDRMETEPDAAGMVSALKLAIDVALFASLGFLGAVLALRGNRDDFAFIIPYVRFRRDASSGQPIVLDAGAVIDGRVAGILDSGFLCGRLIMPSFVLDELQAMAASGNPTERETGQRGLDCLEKMQNSPQIQISVHDANAVAHEEKAHTRLTELARLLNARLLTTDDNLTKLAKLQGVDALNIHELDEALRPGVATGQRIRIPLVRAGKEDDQAVGYLGDGTMIVVNKSAAKIGMTVEVVVTSTLQTSSGLMVFGELYESKA